MSASSIHNTNTTSQAGFPPAPSEALQRANGFEYETDAEVSNAGFFGPNATYSPEDNKLRLYPVTRLDDATYERVKDAGFKWAPKQELFVAPCWTPARADLLVELCGEIGDEDKSLVDRAEERSERFSDYRESRMKDADNARAAVDAITEHIPFGQPILVGHHSERRARKHAEQIEQRMRKSVQMWDTAEYWRRRAAGALRHAKYKADPGVRHRRIKGLQADLRKSQRAIDEAEAISTLWRRDGLTLDRAMAIAGRDRLSACFPLASFPRELPASQYEGSMHLYSALKESVINENQARDIALRAHGRSIAWHTRWADHYKNRIAYEQAMLDEGGGLAVKQDEIAVGGRVLIGREWLVVLRINKARGSDAINSLTTTAPAHVHWCKERKYGPEEVQGYKPPEGDAAAKVKKASTLLKMCNYPGDGFVHMTKAEWANIHADYKGSRDVGANVQPKGTYRPQIKQPSNAAQLAPHRVRVVVRGGLVGVYLTDSKRVDPQPFQAETIESSPVGFDREIEVSEPVQKVYKAPEPNDFDKMREHLRAGVQVVSAPQLFPTPAGLACRMVDMANIQAGQAVLEPSAGTGRILAAIRQAEGSAIRTAVEINQSLCAQLRRDDPGAYVIHADFLEWDGGTQGFYDSIILNPPFANADDIKHIKHALGMLKSGGRLVAICANGPRQNEVLRPIVNAAGGHWEVLPSGTFEGTGVTSVLLTVTKV